MKSTSSQLVRGAFILRFKVFSHLIKRSFPKWLFNWLMLERFVVRSVRECFWQQGDTEGKRSGAKLFYVFQQSLGRDNRP